MKVAKWYNNQDIRIEEEPTPKPGPDEMLVKVISCGICGSDVVEWYRLPRAPLVQGHEIGAEVVETGSGVGGFKPGDRVFIAPKVPCMECEYCKKGRYPVCSDIKERLPGGFAEYILAPQALIEHGAYALPDNLTYDQSTFIEPLACVVAAQRIAGLEKGQSVLVMGCGMSGLLHVQLAKNRGCKVIATDINPMRLTRAKGYGADAVVNPGDDDVLERLLDQNGKPADLVMMCTSALPAVEQAWNCVDKGGSIVFFAVPGPEKQVAIPLSELWTREIQIKTSYYCGPPDIAESMELIRSGRIVVDELVTQRFPLDEIAAGFAMVIDGSDSIKIIIKPHE